MGWKLHWGTSGGFFLRFFLCHGSDRRQKHCHQTTQTNTKKLSDGHIHMHVRQHMHSLSYWHAPSQTHRHVHKKTYIRVSVHTHTHAHTHIHMETHHISPESNAPPSASDPVVLTRPDRPKRGCKIMTEREEELKPLFKSLQTKPYSNVILTVHSNSLRTHTHTHTHTLTQHTHTYHTHTYSLTYTHMNCQRWARAYRPCGTGR